MDARALVLLSGALLSCGADSEESPGRAGSGRGHDASASAARADAGASGANGADAALGASDTAAPGTDTTTDSVTSPASDAGVGPTATVIESPAGDAAALPTSSEPPPAAKPPPGSELFVPGQVLEVRLQLSEADWQSLNEHGNLEEYKPASATLSGVGVGSATFAQLGLRHKGNWSLHHCWDDFGGVRSYEDSCAKLSFKLKFDEYEADTRFDGLKRLNLHAASGDATKLRERIAYSTFSDFGLVAPRTAWAQVFINDEPQGLFLAVEEVDGRFTRAHFPDAPNGNLYKEVWPNASLTDEDFLEALETNEEAADVSDMRAFAELVTGLSGAEHAQLAQWVNIDELLRYIAVDRALKNWDGIMAFYQVETPHNFFWYHAPEEGQFHLIPWDLDNTLWDFDPYMAPEQWVTAEAIPNWNVEPRDCNRRTIWEYDGDESVVPPRCDNLLDLLAEQQWERFNELGLRLLGDTFSAATLLAKAAALSKEVAPLITQDPTLDYETWQLSVSEFEYTLGDAVTDFEAFLASGLAQEADPGEPPPSGLDGGSLDITPDRGLLVDRVTNFEFAEPPVTLEPEGAFGAGDELTSYVASWNTSAPIAGSADLRLDYAFYNGPEAYDEWVNLGISCGSTDMRGSSVLYFSILADAPRTVRVRVLSEAYDAEFGGIWSEFGYDLQVSASVTEVAVPFELLTYPDWAKESWVDAQGFGDLSDAQALQLTLSQFAGVMFVPLPTWDEAGALLQDPESGSLQVDDIYFQ